MFMHIIFINYNRYMFTVDEEHDDIISFLVV